MVIVTFAPVVWRQFLCLVGMKDIRLLVGLEKEGI